MNKQQALNKIEELKRYVKGLKKPLVQEVSKTIKWGVESDEEMTWEEAKKWCEEQGGRLPTRFELQCAYEDEEIRETFQANLYWSSTENSSTYVWTVNFNFGSTFYNNKTYAYYVRCVLMKDIEYNYSPELGEFLSRKGVEQVLKKQREEIIKKIQENHKGVFTDTEEEDWCYIDDIIKLLTK